MVVVVGTFLLAWFHSEPSASDCGKRWVSEWDSSTCNHRPTNRPTYRGRTSPLAPKISSQMKTNAHRIELLGACVCMYFGKLFCHVLIDCTIACSLEHQVLFKPTSVELNASRCCGCFLLGRSLRVSLFLSLFDWDRNQKYYFFLSCQICANDCRNQAAHVHWNWLGSNGIEPNRTDGPKLFELFHFSRISIYLSFSIISSLDRLFLIKPLALQRI